MAITATLQSKIKVAPLRWQTHTKIDMDNSYPTGGESVSASNLGLTTLSYVASIYATGGYLATWDPTNSKVMLYWADFNIAADSALVQVTDTTDVSAVDVYITAVGK